MLGLRLCKAHVLESLSVAKSKRKRCIKVSRAFSCSASKSCNQNGSDVNQMDLMKEAIRDTLKPRQEIDLSTPSAAASSAQSHEYGKLKLSQDNMIVDTYALIKAFKQQGFSTEQAECLTYTFTQIINDALKDQRRQCVEKASLDIAREQIMAHIGALRKDMTILEKSELSDLRNENDKLKLLLSQTKSEVMEEVNRVKNQLTLDINMERSRAKDDFTKTEKNISSLTTKMTAGLGNLETLFERYKNDIYKFIAGSLASGITVSVAVYRAWKS